MSPNKLMMHLPLFCVAFISSGLFAAEGTDETLLSLEKKRCVLATLSLLLPFDKFDASAEDSMDPAPTQWDRQLELLSNHVKIRQNKNRAIKQGDDELNSIMRPLKIIAKSQETGKPVLGYNIFFRNTKIKADEEERWRNRYAPIGHAEFASRLLTFTKTGRYGFSHAMIVAVATPAQYGVTGVNSYIRLMLVPPRQENREPTIIVQKDMGRQVDGIDEFLPEYPFADWDPAQAAFLEEYHLGLTNSYGDGAIPQKVNENFIAQFVAPVYLVAQEYYKHWSFRSEAESHRRAKQKGLSLVSENNTALAPPEELHQYANTLGELFEPYDHDYAEPGKHILRLIPEEMSKATGPDSPYMGYVFIDSAGISWLTDADMSKSFVLIATPLQYKQTGQLTFIIGKDPTEKAPYFIVSVDMGKTAISVDDYKELGKSDSRIIMRRTVDSLPFWSTDCCLGLLEIPGTGL